MKINQIKMREMREMKRIKFLDVPIDTMDQESALEKIKEFSRDSQRHQIIFLNTKNLFKAKRDKEYYRCIKTCSLILPISMNIIKGARFQKKPTLTQFNPFNFIIRLLSAAEHLKQSVYLLGSKKEDLEKVESNLRTSYPLLHIVGRYTGYFNKSVEENILLSIKKASPTFLLVGKGMKNSDKWILNNRDSLNPGIFFTVDNCFEIFSGKEKNTPEKSFNMFLQFLIGIIIKPWHIFRIFPYIYFKLLVLIYKIKKL